MTHNDIWVCNADCNGSCHHPTHCADIKKIINLSVQQFSMLPLQAGLEVETPDGIGLYSGITESGIVKVFIGGGYKDFSWSDCKPMVMLHHIETMESFTKSLISFKAIQALTKEPGPKSKAPYGK